MRGGPFLRTLAQARAINWDHSWQWDVQFPDAPAPFNVWFPAVQASRAIAALETHSFVGFGDTHDIPFASSLRTFNVTFTDSHTGTVMKWLDDWMELDTLFRGDGTARLANIVRQCLLAQLNSVGQPVRIWSLNVYPFGGLTFTGNSQSQFRDYIVSFRIAGLDNPEE